MTELKDIKILVVGGAGFVGSNLVRHLLSQQVASVDIVDNLLSAERSNIPDDARACFIVGSIADDAILANIQDEYDYIFHLSTYHGNQSSIANPLVDHENNTLTTLKLLEHVKGFRRLKKWVYSGAGCAVAEKTYEQAHATPEDAPISLKMDSPYSISKIVGEFYAVYYMHSTASRRCAPGFRTSMGPGRSWAPGNGGAHLRRFGGT
jgi:nucleoside-diphosphate-sugar epimerase